MKTTTAGLLFLPLAVWIVEAAPTTQRAERFENRTADLAIADH